MLSLVPLLIVCPSPSKFPEIESSLQEWLLEMDKTKQILTDASIRAKAKEVARGMEIPEDKFKASSGWIENFKHRHGIRRGVWHGDGKNTRAARAMGCGHPLEESDDDEPRKTMCDLYPAYPARFPPPYNSSLAGATDLEACRGDINMATKEDDGPRPVELPRAWQPLAHGSSTEGWQPPAPPDTEMSGPTPGHITYSEGWPPAAHAEVPSRDNDTAVHETPWTHTVDIDQGRPEHVRTLGPDSSWSASHSSVSPDENSTQSLNAVSDSYQHPPMHPPGGYDSQSGQSNMQNPSVPQPPISQSSQPHSPGITVPPDLASMKDDHPVIPVPTRTTFDGIDPELISTPRARISHVENCLDTLIGFCETQPGFLKDYQRRVLGELKVLMFETQLDMERRC
jgi:hypothetical protein